MQYVHGVGESDGIDGSIRVAVPVFDDFEDSRGAEAFQWLREIRLCADLSQMQRESYDVLHFGRHGEQIFLARCDPHQRLDIACLHLGIIPKWG